MAAFGIPLSSQGVLVYSNASIALCTDTCCSCTLDLYMLFMSCPASRHDAHPTDCSRLYMVDRPLTPYSATIGSTEAQRAVQDFLNSLRGGTGGQQQGQAESFTTLMDLLPSSITVPIIESASPALIDALCANLPPVILLLAQEIDDVAEVDQTSDTAQAAIEALDQESKKDILKRVLSSPQMQQSLASLTFALRDGGLPNVSQALKIDVENGGYMRGGGMPLGGGDAIKAFLEGVKRTVKGESEGDQMDTD